MSNRSIPKSFAVYAVGILTAISNLMDLVSDVKWAYYDQTFTKMLSMVGIVVCILFAIGADFPLIYASLPGDGINERVWIWMGWMALRMLRLFTEFTRFDADQKWMATREKVTSLSVMTAWTISMFVTVHYTCKLHKALGGSVGDVSERSTNLDDPVPTYDELAA